MQSKFGPSIATSPQSISHEVMPTLNVVSTIAPVAMRAAPAPTEAAPTALEAAMKN